MSKKVLIVGGGFGGVKAALELQKHEEFEITVISSEPYFEYHAALYRSATGWSPSEVILPLVDIFDENSNVKVITAKVSKINADKKLVTDNNNKSYHYDELIISTGQITNFYGLKNLEKYAFSMNSIEQALKLRQHLRDTVQNSDENSLEFAVIGGGATGVELASEISFFVNELCKKYKIPKKKTHVTLIEGAPRVLQLLSPKASKFAEWRLEDLGIKVLLSTQVIDFKNGELILSDRKLKTQSVIWTAGASNNPIFSENSKIFKIAKNGKVEVDEYLKANKNIYVIGDNANTQFSGMAQTALYDGKFIAKNLIRKIHNKPLNLYVPHRPIYAIPVGRNFAVLQWGNFVFQGKLAWLMRRIADIRLFFRFEPYRKAIKTWRAGNHRASGYEIK